MIRKFLHMYRQTTFPPKVLQAQSKNLVLDWLSHTWKGILPFTSLNGTLEVLNVVGDGAHLKAPICKNQGAGAFIRTNPLLSNCTPYMEILKPK